MEQIRVTTRALKPKRMTEVLTRHHVGRMAFTLHDRVSIVLVNYLFSEGWIYSRMEMGTDLVTLLHNRWVAFEVDEVDGLYDWRTVSVNGSVQFLSDGPSMIEARDFKAAADLIQSVVPSVLTPADPMPQRVQLFRIFVDQMTGTEARSNAGDKLPSA
jgi:nitroimidazol reductase NimA-like FMN-containing flavoprotein (pyridoxamine 5'-phosphate oxidase superfamily)